jgi:hypothetical protein
MPQIRFKPEPYTCIRCGYATPDKAKMKIHFGRKRPCPGSVNNIEFTEDIKQCILDNRVYAIPKSSSHNNIINNYNTINNFIVNLDPMNKLTTYINYKDVQLISLEQQLEAKYQRRNNKMREKLGCHEVTNNDLYEAIHSVTRCTNSEFTDYNVVYDSKVGKLMIRYNGGEWAEYSISKGVTRIVEMLKEFHLDNYEQYLLRMIEEPCATTMIQHKQKCSELIREYYSFLVCFDLDPYVQTATAEIVQGKDLLDIQDTYTKLYNSVYDTTTLRKQRQLKAELIEAIKSNGKSNIADLNKHLLFLIQGDANFKDLVMAGYKGKSLAV